MRNPFTILGAACWLSYLIDGDSSGLDESEKQACDNWLAIELNPGQEIVDCGEPFFSWSFGLHTHTSVKGGDLVEYTVLDRELPDNTRAHDLTN